LRFWLENDYSFPQNWIFGGFLPCKWGAVTTKSPKGIHGCRNTSFDATVVKIGEMVDTSRFFEIFKMAAVCHLGFVGAQIWTTHEDYLVVFIVLQNVAGINADLLIL